MLVRVNGCQNGNVSIDLLIYYILILHLFAIDSQQLLYRLYSITSNFLLYYSYECQLSALPFCHLTLSWIYVDRYQDLTSEDLGIYSRITYWYSWQQNVRRGSSCKQRKEILQGAIFAKYETGMRTGNEREYKTRNQSWSRIVARLEHVVRENTTNISRHLPICSSTYAQEEGLGFTLICNLHCCNKLI